MPARAIHHVDLAVSDVQRSLAFYLAVLGPLGLHEDARYPTYRGTEEVVYLGWAKQQLGLRQADPGEYRYYDEDVSVPVLVAVDEDARALRGVERELVDRYSRSYRVVCVPSAEEAMVELELLADAGGDVALVFAAQWLSGTTGRADAQAVRAVPGARGPGSGQLTA